MKRRLAPLILIGMLLGVATGFAIHHFVTDVETGARIGTGLSLATDVFLRLLKMVIAPLVLATLVTGIARLGDASAVGRIGLRAMAWFLVASLLSLGLGLLLGNLFQPGAGLAIAVSADAGRPLAGSLTAQSFLSHAIPQSIFESMARNDVLAIVVFAGFLGVALGAMGSAAAPVLRGLDILTDAMMRVTGYIMRLTPIAAFAAMAHVIGANGPGVLVGVGKFAGVFYAGLAILWLIFALIAIALFGRRAKVLAREIREPVLVGFSTASSEATLPSTLTALERFGIPRPVASFVLPLGYAFNLDGSMMYMTLGALFIAQACGVPMGLGEQMLLALTLLLASKGMASVPRASLVVLASILDPFGLPHAGLLLIMAIDQLLDMGRTATNVVGNSLATAAIGRWETHAPAQERPA
ncbi:MAG: dicarboxylate/amino acid:cation symporter [Sphingomonadales bacterium]|nr:dicarboxylate/amino acid:cation symporter [Sphingomonadales bacterium]